MAVEIDMAKLAMIKACLPCYEKDLEIARLKQWQRDMVAKAAAEHNLDGYRELGAKCAALEDANGR